MSSSVGVKEMKDGGGSVVAHAVAIYNSPTTKSASPVKPKRDKLPPLTLSSPAKSPTKTRLVRVRRNSQGHEVSRVVLDDNVTSPSRTRSSDLSPNSKKRAVKIMKRRASVEHRGTPLSDHLVTDKEETKSAAVAVAQPVTVTSQSSKKGETKPPRNKSSTGSVSGSLRSPKKANKPCSPRVTSPDKKLSLKGEPWKLPMAPPLDGPPDEGHTQALRMVRIILGEATSIVNRETVDRVLQKHADLLRIQVKLKQQEKANRLNEPAAALDTKQVVKLEADLNKQKDLMRTALEIKDVEMNILKTELDQKAIKIQQLTWRLAKERSSSKDKAASAAAAMAATSSLTDRAVLAEHELTEKNEAINVLEKMVENTVTALRGKDKFLRQLVEQRTCVMCQPIVSIDDGHEPPALADSGHEDGDGDGGISLDNVTDVALDQSKTCHVKLRPCMMNECKNVTDDVSDDATPIMGHSSSNGMDFAKDSALPMLSQKTSSSFDIKSATSEEFENELQITKDMLYVAQETISKLEEAKIEMESDFEETMHESLSKISQLKGVLIACDARRRTAEQRLRELGQFDEGQIVEIAQKKPDELVNEIVQRELKSKSKISCSGSVSSVNTTELLKQQNEVENLTQRLAQTRAELLKMGHDVELKITQGTANLSTVADLKAQLKSCQKQLGTTREKVVFLEAEKTSVAHQLESTTLKLEKISTEVDEAQQSLRLSVSQHGKTVTEMDEAKKLLQSSNTCMQEKIINLQNQLNEATAAIRVSQETVDDFKAQQVSASKKISALKVEKSAIVQELSNAIRMSEVVIRDSDLAKQALKKSEDSCRRCGIEVGALRNTQRTMNVEVDDDTKKEIDNAVVAHTKENSKSLKAEKPMVIQEPANSAVTCEKVSEDAQYKLDAPSACTASLALGRETSKGVELAPEGSDDSEKVEKIVLGERMTETQDSNATECAGELNTQALSETILVSTTKNCADNVQSMSDVVSITKGDKMDEESTHETTGDIVSTGHDSNSAFDDFVENITQRGPDCSKQRSEGVRFPENKSVGSRNLDPPKSSTHSSNTFELSSESGEEPISAEPNYIARLASLEKELKVRQLQLQEAQVKIDEHVMGRSETAIVLEEATMSLQQAREEVEKLKCELLMSEANLLDAKEKLMHLRKVVLAAVPPECES